MGPSDRSFLSSPDEVADWRTIVLTDVALDTGILSALPGTAADVASAAGTEETGTRVILEALRVWDVVTVDNGVYEVGPGAPEPEEAAVVHQHANAIGRWSTVLRERLGWEPGTTSEEQSRKGTQLWLDSMAMRARERAPAFIDACLGAVANVNSVLDLGGGHGEYALEFARRGLEVTMQDLPEVIHLARERGRLEAGGVTLSPGNFFYTVGERTHDLVLLSGVAHVYPDHVLEELYGRIRTVTARALIVSASMRDGRPHSSLFAVHMLTGRAGTDLNTEATHIASLEAAGFDRVDVIRQTEPARDLLVARVG